MVSPGKETPNPLERTKEGETLELVAHSLAKETGIDLNRLIAIRDGGCGRAVVSAVPCRRNFGEIFENHFKEFTTAYQAAKDNDLDSIIKQSEMLVEELMKILLLEKEGKITNEELADPDFTLALHYVVRDFAKLEKINPENFFSNHAAFKYGEALEPDSLQPTLDNVGPKLHRGFVIAARLYAKDSKTDSVGLIGDIDSKKRMTQLRDKS